MFYPTLSPENTSRDFIDVFGGYNHNVRIGENEFYDMKNLSSDMYPLLATRHKRKLEDSKTVQMVAMSSIGDVVYYLYAAPNNLIALNKGGVNIWMFANTVDPSATVKAQRQIVPMGAYLIILPDKKYINLAKYDEEAADPDDRYPDKGNIEAEKTIAASGLTVQPCLADGTVVSIDYAGISAPDNPADGSVWLDSSMDPPTLKKWYGSNSMWVEQSGGYVRLYKENEAISANFAEGDALRVSGFSGVEFVNGLSMVKAKPDNDTLVITADTQKTNYGFTFFEPITTGVNKLQVKVKTSTEATANYYAGAEFLFGGKKAICTESTATSPAQDWIIDTTTDFTTNHDWFVVTKNIDQSVGVGSALLIPLDPGESFSEGLVGRRVRIGDRETVIRLVQSQSENSYIYLADGVDAPASTEVYLLKIGDVPGEYEITLTLQSRVKINENTTIMLYPDLNIQQSNAVTLARKMPIMDYVVESKNRLWGCYYGESADGEIVNEIYASKLGDFKNWQCYEGSSTDSYAASCGTDGAWTGVITYMGSPLFFKENYIHTVSGSFPAQFQINSIKAQGVKENCAGSLAILDETLFYLSNHGVCAYNGGFPAEISEAFGDVRYKDAQAGAYNGKYYICMKEDKAGSPPSVLMVYDKKRGLWHKEDDIDIVHFCAINDDLLYVTANNKYGSIYGGTETEPIQWNAETGIYGLSMIDSKYISRMNIRLALDMGSYISVSIEYDSSGMWEKLCFVQASSLRPFTLPIKPRRCDHFRLRLEGSGSVKIYSISKTLMQGSDL